MRFARRAGRRDSSENPCLTIAAAHGWEWEKFDGIDCILWRHHPDTQTTEVLLVEFKTGNAPLTDYQTGLKKRGMPLNIVRTVEEAEELFT